MQTSTLKKALVLLMALVLVCALAACGAAPAEEAAEEPTEETAENTAENTAEGDTITVTDMAGRQVEVPRDVQSVATVYGVAANFLVSIGASDKITAMGFTNDFYNMVDANLANVGTVGKGKVDMEAIAELKPDLFIHKANDIETLDQVQALGIPSIGIYAESQEDIKTVITLLGQVLGLEENAEAMLSYYDTMMEDAKGLVADVAEADKKTAIVMGSEIGKVADGSMLQSNMIEAAGGINCAKDIETTELWPTVGTEEIFDWNPDFIFLTGSSSSEYTVADLEASDAWKDLEAVKNGNVFLVPCEMDSWEFPSVCTALGTLWMVSKMYPEKLSEEDLNAKVADFYKTVYNIDATPETMGY